MLYIYVNSSKGTALYLRNKSFWFVRQQKMHDQAVYVLCGKCMGWGKVFLCFCPLPLWERVGYLRDSAEARVRGNASERLTCLDITPHAASLSLTLKCATFSHKGRREVRISTPHPELVEGQGHRSLIQLL